MCWITIWYLKINIECLLEYILSIQIKINNNQYTWHQKFDITHFRLEPLHGKPGRRARRSPRSCSPCAPLPFPTPIRLDPILKESEGLFKFCDTFQFNSGTWNKLKLLILFDASSLRVITTMLFFSDLHVSVDKPSCVSGNLRWKKIDTVCPRSSYPFYIVGLTM